MISFAPKRNRFVLTVLASYHKVKGYCNRRQGLQLLRLRWGAGAGGNSTSETLASLSAKVVRGRGCAAALFARGIVGRAAGAVSAAILASFGVAALSLQAAFMVAVHFRE